MRRQRAVAPALVAVWIGIGKVFPHNVLVAVDLDDAGVIRISDERALLQPAGEGDTAHRIVDVRVTAALLPYNVSGAGDLDRAVVVFVADEDVTVLQKLAPFGLLSCSGPLPETPVVPYCQMIRLARLTSMTCSFA